MDSVGVEQIVRTGWYQLGLSLEGYPCSNWSPVVGVVYGKLGSEEVLCQRDLAKMLCPN